MQRKCGGEHDAQRKRKDQREKSEITHTVGEGVCSKVRGAFDGEGD